MAHRRITFAARVRERAAGGGPERFPQGSGAHVAACSPAIRRPRIHRRWDVVLAGGDAHESGSLGQEIDLWPGQKDVVAFLSTGDDRTRAFGRAIA